MELPGTLVFDYPTVAAIAGYIASKQAPSAMLAVAASQPLTRYCHAMCWLDKAADNIDKKHEHAGPGFYLQTHSQFYLIQLTPAAA